MIQELIKDMAKYLPSYFVPALVGLGTIPIITHLFPPGDYGDYVLVMMTVSILSTLSIGWLTPSIIRFYPSHDSEETTGTFYHTVITSAIVSILFVSTLFGSVLYLLKSYVLLDLYIMMCLGILVFIVTAFFTDTPASITLF